MDIEACPGKWRSRRAVAHNVAAYQKNVVAVPGAVGGEPGHLVQTFGGQLDRMVQNKILVKRDKDQAHLL
jgi:predicted metal-binding protein